MEEVVKHNNILLNGLWLMYWNIQKLIENFQLEHTSRQWMLFTVSSKVSLKTMLIHSGNKIISVSLVKAINMTETQE